MLGHKLVQVLHKEADVWYTLRGRFEDVEDYSIFEEQRCVEYIDADGVAETRKTIERLRPDVVINAIGIVKQVSDSKNVIRTLTVNSIFPHRLNEFAVEFGFRLICISTDCVFDGNDGNYSEMDMPNAVDLYGKSKNLGEVVSDRALTLRTSIIGRELQTSHSLVEWFLSNKGKSIKGYANAIYSGFPTVVLADIIKSLIFEHPYMTGLYHVSSDPISKFDLLNLLNNAYGSNIVIRRDEDFKIDRSLDSSKFWNETKFISAGWDEMIEKMAKDPTPYENWRK